MRERTRRLFFALWPPRALQAALAQALLPKIEASGGRATPFRNYHATLAFVGNVPVSRFADVCACAAGVADAAAFDVTLDHIESWRRSGVLALTGVPDPRLASLVEQLRINLLNAQFQVQHEDYRLHLTLARDVRHRIAKEAITPVSWTAREMTLVESRTSATGSEYEIVEQWPLTRAL